MYKLKHNTGSRKFQCVNQLPKKCEGCRYLVIETHCLEGDRKEYSCIFDSCVKKDVKVK